MAKRIYAYHHRISIFNDASGTGDNVKMHGVINVSGGMLNSQKKVDHAVRQLFKDNNIEEFFLHGLYCVESLSLIGWEDVDE